MAATRPAWASEVTSLTPDRPRAVKSRKNASQPAPSSLVVTFTPRTPRISRCPWVLTPVVWVDGHRRVLLESLVRDHSKDHAVAVAASTATRSPGAVHDWTSPR